MKKNVLIIATIVLAANLSNAQDMMSKKGTPILPEVKDWSIGIDANPILEYFGNAFNHSDNAAPAWDFTTNPMVITGLMVKDANTAYRAKVRLGISSSKRVYKVNDDLSTATPAATKDDEVKTTSRNIILGAGIQKNRGKGRLRGIYGAEAMIGFSGGKTEHTFANAMTATNPTPSTNIPGETSGSTSRTTKIKNGSGFMFGIRGFIGAEYFFAPKISVAGEFGWGPALNSTGEGEVTTESSSGASPNATVTTNSAKTGKFSSFSFDTDNNSGAIRISFYF